MGDENIRKVRAPRFSDAEWRRLEAQLFKVRSPKHTPFKPRLMTAHEFVWAAAMRAVHLLEEVPKGDKPYNLEEVVGRPGAVHQPAAAVGARKAERPASARRTPLWEGSKLANEDLGLALEWDPLEKPSGEPPSALIPAMIKEHRARDMRDCPVEIAVRRPQPKGRRRPPIYSKVCCICEWPHALPVNWPFDDGGAQLNEEQRDKLEMAVLAACEELEAEKAAAGGQRRRRSARPSAGAAVEKAPPACGLCEDTGRHIIDKDVCRCRTEGLVCGLCDDQGFYTVSTSLSPCTCAAGRSIVAKGPAYVKRCKEELSKAKKAERAALKAPPGSSDEFYTPSRIFLPLHEEFGFTLDVCATAESTKVPERFFTKDDDALAEHCIWEGHVWWCNPPYSPGNLEAFLAKCDQEARKPGHRVGVALLPARTGNAWWHQYIDSNLELQRTSPEALPFSLEVRFHKGRIAFGWPGNPEGGKGTGRDNSAFVIWRRRA